MKKEIQGYSSESIRSRLKKVEITESYSDLVKESLETTVFGQEEACDAVADIVTRYEAELNDPKRPGGVVVFLGPTGTGKTAMGISAAQHLFGEDWKRHFKNIDCSEYSEPHTVSRFVGSPPGYVGYGDELVFDSEFLDERNVIVFDEIEKADLALPRLLLAIFENGILHARSGVGDNDTIEEELKFNKSLIIVTTNVGAQQMQESQRGRLGFLSKEKKPDIQSAAMDGLKKSFAAIPEFLGRIDDFVVFKPLEKNTYLKIYWKFVGELNELLVNKNVFFSTTTELAEVLIDKAVGNGEYGARDIRHILNKELFKPLANILISNSRLTAMVADIENGKIVFYDLSPEIEETERGNSLNEMDNNDENFDILLHLMDIDQAEKDGYRPILVDEQIGEIMTNLLYITNYQKWKGLADRITTQGIEEKMKAKRVFGEALKIMEDEKLQERFPVEWKVYKDVLMSYGVIL